MAKEKILFIYIDFYQFGEILKRASAWISPREHSVYYLWSPSLVTWIM